MQNGLHKMWRKLPLVLVLLAVTDLACGVTFKGALIPQTFDLPIPVVVELEKSGGRFSGTIKTSSPLTGEGLITGEPSKGYLCNLTSDIGIGVGLRLEGVCMPTFMEGKYTLYLRNGRQLQGTFSLTKAQPEKKIPAKPKDDPSEPRVVAGPTTTSCLKENTACLAACPRGDESVEFMCTNSCRHRLALCKARVKKLNKDHTTTGS